MSTTLNFLAKIGEYSKADTEFQDVIENFVKKHFSKNADLIVAGKDKIIFQMETSTPVWYYNQENAFEPANMYNPDTLDLAHKITVIPNLCDKFNIKISTYGDNIKNINDVVSDVENEIVNNCKTFLAKDVNEFEKFALDLNTKEWTLLVSNKERVCKDSNQKYFEEMQLLGRQSVAGFLISSAGQMKDKDQYRINKYSEFIQDFINKDSYMDKMGVKLSKCLDNNITFTFNNKENDYNNIKVSMETDLLGSLNTKATGKFGRLQVNDTQKWHLANTILIFLSQDIRELKKGMFFHHEDMEWKKNIQSPSMAM